MPLMIITRKVPGTVGKADKQTIYLQQQVLYSVYKWIIKFRNTIPNKYIWIQAILFWSTIKIGKNIKLPLNNYMTCSYIICLEKISKQILYEYIYLLYEQISYIYLNALIFYMSIYIAFWSVERNIAYWASTVFLPYTAQYSD